MRLEDLQYQLPPELIATHPPAERDGARLLVVPVTGQSFEHRSIRELPQLLPEGALLIVNDTKVIPARLFGHKADSGGRVELLLVRRTDDGDERRQRWEALGRSSKPLRAGLVIEMDGKLRATVIDRDDGGLLTIWLESPGASANETIDELLEVEGEIPLPPYIRRAPEPSDRERYQTLFARQAGAVAAPTAGLHFSEDLLARLAERDILTASVTLHVGPGTFRPVSVDDLNDHDMHAEHFEVGEETADRIASARAEGRPVVAIGTTVVRALESSSRSDGSRLVSPQTGVTRLLIQPGFAFRVIDGLVTNFHLPGSTLLALVGAFSGLDRMLAAYREAIAKRYRFYSYGDAMYLRSR
ncbi:tRNA preQ1(34) S-adenosylmethionine ribosyltransferase-isomerase QueA [Endomicrobium sp. AH-315-J14]|nr:tRNA preQ1(34) S-adenosylmethionine ribosyltransferase-isomerase QueA [Endomicrobium sp. AH-315-J14]